MQLKHIGIAAAIVAGGLVVALQWAQPGRVGAFETVTQQTPTDAGADGAGDSGPYRQGRPAGGFDLHPGGTGGRVTNLLWIQRNT